jgi:uncharacterized membrane protein YqiK
MYIIIIIIIVMIIIIVIIIVFFFSLTLCYHTCLHTLLLVSLGGYPGISFRSWKKNLQIKHYSGAKAS